MADLKPVNYYDRVEIKGQGIIQGTYKGHNLVKIDIPFRSIICGASGSKKTNTLINIIRNIPAFQHYYLYARNPNQELFKYLKDKFETVANKLNISIDDIITVHDTVKELPSDLKKFHPNSLIVFDDLQTSSTKDKQKIANIFCNSRSFGLSCIWIGQSYFKIPLELRENVDYIFYKRTNSAKDLRRMIREYLSTPEEEDRFDKYYNQVLANDNFFVLIDLKSINPKLKIRLNFGH